MRRAFLALILLVAGLMCLQQRSSAQLSMTGVGGSFGSGTAAFSGPGDVVSGALAYWGAEAYNAAYATGLNKAFNVCLALDATCGDLSFGADGSVVNTAVGGSLCSAVTCTIKTAYDHTGNGNDVTNATIATRPTISFNCQGGRACMVFASGAFLTKTNWNSSSDVAMPWTISIVYIDTGTVDADGGALVSTSAAGHASLYSNNSMIGGAPNLIECFAGAALDSTATDGSWHSVAAVGNGASSDMNVDGLANAGDCGSRLLRSAVVFLGADDTPAAFVGRIGRAGVWPSGFSGGNSTAVSAQDHTFWGF